MFPAPCNALFPLIVSAGCKGFLSNKLLSADKEEINSEMPGCIINIQNENWPVFFYLFFFTLPAVIGIVIIKLSWDSSVWSRELHSEQTWQVQPGLLSCVFVFFSTIWIMMQFNGKS